MSMLSDMHPGWRKLTARVLRQRTTSRRQFLTSGAGALAVLSCLPAGCGGGGSSGSGSNTGSSSGTSSGSGSSGPPDQADWPSNNPIKHVVVLCQENRSFDHYFGAFADSFGSGANTAVGFTPSALAYPNSAGTLYHPYHAVQFCEEDPDHSWGGSHDKWNLGAMDGWVTGDNGLTGSIGYMEAADHIYHVQLAQAFTLADQYFCSQIGPTVPNRLYLWSGTSGWDFLSPADTSGLPYNNPSSSGAPPSLKWQTMADVLDAAKLPWKSYSVADGSVPTTIGAFNPLIFFSQFQDNATRLAKATADFSEFASDLAAGTLPAVSWIVTEAAVSEHPPAPPDLGQLLVAKVVEDLMASSAWSSTALFIAYDEGGGFFDHVPPSILENVAAGLPDAAMAVGPGFRVPMTIVSPYAPANTVYSGVVDHTSILQFIERTFSTASTPVTLPAIAAARRDLDDLTLAFDFAQEPNSPSLPTAVELYNQLSGTILSAGGVAGCSAGLPSWFPPLLGVS